MSSGMLYLKMRIAEQKKRAASGEAAHNGIDLTS